MENNQLKCTRCNNIWYQKGEKIPSFCAKCNSPYWNQKRRVRLPEWQKHIRIKDYFLNKKYNFSTAQKEAMLFMQDMKCASCKRLANLVINFDGHRVVNLLCRPCNLNKEKAP